MPSLKEVRSRIQSVVSTQQITKAMKMVAAAKLRRAQDRIIRMRPFESRMTTLLANLLDNLDGDLDLKLAKPNGSQGTLIIIVTSDRGLCGAFNTNVIRAVSQLLSRPGMGTGPVHLMALGKRGAEFFGRRGQHVSERYRDVFLNLGFEVVADAADAAIEAYRQGQYGQVMVVYNEFKNVATQIVRTEQLLPLAVDELLSAPGQSGAKGPGTGPRQEANYILEPAADTLIEQIIPKLIRLKLYKAVLESNASEHGARMTAMDKATDNAGELLKELRLTYNRSRQAAITKEILEIVGGAEALSGK